MTPLTLLPATVTVMAARAQSAAIAAVGTDMAAWDRWSATLDKWMAHPEFDAQEFSRLCLAYGLG